MKNATSAPSTTDSAREIRVRPNSNNRASLDRRRRGVRRQGLSPPPTGALHRSRCTGRPGPRASSSRCARTARSFSTGQADRGRARGVLVTIPRLRPPNRAAKLAVAQTRQPHCVVQTDQRGTADAIGWYPFGGSGGPTDKREVHLRMGRSVIVLAGMHGMSIPNARRPAGRSQHTDFASGSIRPQLPLNAETRKPAETQPCCG